jgi:hypothetical protein
VATARRHPRFLMRHRPARLQAPHPITAASQPDEMRHLAEHWPPASPGHRLAARRCLGAWPLLDWGRPDGDRRTGGVEWVWGRSGDDRPLPCQAAARWYCDP